MNTDTEKPVFTSCNDCTHQRHIEEYDEWGCTHEDCRHYPFVRVEHFEPKQKKIIDMSKLVGSDIDCEFGCGNGFSGWGAELRAINECNYICGSNGVVYDECRVRQDHWHSWSGGECPLPEGLLIEVKTRPDSVVSILASYTSNDHGWRWTNPFGDNSEDIIAFKVKGAAYGWKYGWEK